MKLRLVTVFTAIISAFSSIQIIHAEPPDEENHIISVYDFSDDMNTEWMGFGSCFVSIDNSIGESDNSCLKISAREAAWNGPLYVANDIAEVDKTVGFYSKIYHRNDNAVSFKATVKITNPSGENEYREVAFSNVEPGQWTTLSGSFTLDYSASSVLLYIETDDSLCDFYVDTIRLFDGEIPDEYAPSDSDARQSGEPDPSELTTVFHDDFESGSTGNWAPSAESTLYLKRDPVSDNNNCLAVCNRQNNYDSPLINITDLVIPKEKYYFTGRIFNQSDHSEKYTWTTRIQNSNGVNNYLQFASVTCQPGCWETLSGVLTIPEDVIDIEIYFDTISVNSEYCIDDIDIKGTQFKETKTVSIGKNGLLYDFEEDMDKWKSRGNIRIFRTDMESHSGKYSLYVSDRIDVWNGAMLSANFLLREKSYTYDAYVKYCGKEYEDEQTFVMKLQYQYQGKTEYSSVAEAVVKKDKWTRLTGNFTLPESAQNISLYLHTIDTNIPTQTDLMPFYIDDVSIIETSNARSNENSRKAYDFILVFIPTVLIAFIVFKIVHKKKKTN